jgi:hypothetical protein
LFFVGGFTLSKIRKLAVETEFKKAPAEKPTNAEYSVKGTLTHTPKTDCGSDYHLAGGFSF